MRASAGPLAYFQLTSLATDGSSPDSNVVQYVQASTDSAGLLFTTQTPLTVPPASITLTGWFHFANGVVTTPGSVGSQLILANISILAETSGATQGPPVGGTKLTQPIVGNLPGDDMILIRPAAGNALGLSPTANLLTVSGTAVIQGFEPGPITDGTVGVVKASDAVNTITYSSDFVPGLGTATAKSWNIPLSTVTPALGVAPLLVTPVAKTDFAPLAAVPGALNSFTADATGSFAATVSSVPEPASLSVLGLGAAGLLLKKRRKTL